MVDKLLNKDQLIEKRNELQERLDAIKADYGRGLNADSEERAQELENADVLAEISRVTIEELESIEELLSKKP